MLSLSERISGIVIDAADSKPLTAAELAISAQGATLASRRADARGRFELDDLGHGQHQIVISSEGYLSETLEAALPHRGSLEQLEIRLIPIRLKILEAYRGLSRPLLPGNELWACWTPRDLVRYLGHRCPTALIELTSLLERAYWSQGTATPEMLNLARDLAGKQPPP
jgi:hypothetical protein